MELQQLIEKAQQGDSKSYQTFLVEVQKRGRGFLKLRLNKDEIIDEILQEVLLGIHKSLHTYSPGRPVMPWVMSIIKYKLTDFFRRKSEVDSDPLDEESIAAPQGDIVFLKEVLTLLKTLPKNQGELIHMARVEGYSLEEISQRTGMGLSAIKVNVHRGVKRLRRMLSE